MQMFRNQLPHGYYTNQWHSHIGIYAQNQFYDCNLVYEHFEVIYVIALDLQTMFSYDLQLYASCLWTRRALQLCGAAKGPSQC